MRLPAAERQKVKHLADRRQLVTGRETSNNCIFIDLEAETIEEGQTNNSSAETGLATSSIVLIPQTKGPVENASKRNLETVEKSCEISSVAREASERKQRKIVYVDNDVVSTAAADKTEGRISMNSKNSGKSKNKKEFGFPQGFLNRFYRLEPQQVASGLEHVKPCQNEAIEDGDVLRKQPQMLEMEKPSGTNSEVHHLFSSDPCLEFTTKTLRSGVPREGAADESLVSTPASSALKEKNRGKNRKRSNTGTKNSSNSKKIKELDLPRQFSKRLAGLETELVSNGVSTEVAIQSATRKSGKTEEKPSCVLVDEKTQQLNAGRNAMLPSQPYTAAVNPEIKDMNSKNSGKSKNKKEFGLLRGFLNRFYRLEPEQVASGLEHLKPCQNEAIEDDVHRKQPQMLEMEKTSSTNSEVHSLFSSDPCLEFTMKTLRGGVPREDAADGLVSTPASSVLQEKNRGQTRSKRKRNNTGTKNLSNSKKIRELDLPRQFSKRLAGLETELVSNGVSTEVAVQNATRKSGKTEEKALCVLADEGKQQLNVGRNAKLPNQPYTAAVNPDINDISPHEDKTMLVEQPQLSGTKNSSDSKSEVESFFWSEPCLKFGIKTLTGAIPFEDSINERIVSTPVANIHQQKNLADTRTERGRCRKILFNSTRSKKDDSLHQRSSKRVARHAPELVPSSLSNEQVLNFVDRKSYDNKAIGNAVLKEKSSQQVEIGPRMAYRSTLFHDESSNKSKEPRNNKTIPTQMNNENPGQQSAIPSWKAIGNADLTEKSSQQVEIGPRMAYRSTLFHDESSNKSKEARNNKTIPTQMNNENPGQQSAIPSWKAIGNADLTEKSSQQVEIGPRMAYRSTLFHDESSNKSKEPPNNKTIPTQMNNENPGQQSAIPSWSFWYDPCFKSPFRTVADSLPAQGSFAFQRNLPDPGLPNIFRSDIPSHVERTGQPVLQQQLPSSPPFLPLSNVSFPSSSTIGVQQSSRKGKSNYQTR